MPLYMDVHALSESVAMDDVAQAHAADLRAQAPHDVQFLRYWVAESEGRIFCLVDAPRAEAVNVVHEQAHGLVADEVYSVKEGV